MKVWKVELSEEKNPTTKLTEITVVADDWVGAGELAIKSEKEWPEKATVTALSLDSIPIVEGE